MWNRFDRNARQNVSQSVVAARSGKVARWDRLGELNDTAHLVIRESEQPCEPLWAVREPRPTISPGRPHAP